MEMNQIEILETIQAANLYFRRLNDLHQDLDSAEKQIEITVEETKINIHVAFNKMRNQVLDIINKKQNALLEKVEKIKNEAMAPLEDCHICIVKKMEQTAKFIEKGATILEQLTDCGADVKTFSKDASLLGSLPEVPELKDVPYISFFYEPSLEFELINKLGNSALLYKIPPVQISDFTEKPGAILVEWKVLENDERITDVDEFRLQKAFGDINDNLAANFHDCYTGVDTQCLIKDLQDHQPYSFRVSCKFEGTTEWSPWSLPQVARTSLKHFTWMDNPNYIFSNEYKAAKPKGNSEEMLYSSSDQFSVGHSIDFMFLEGDSSYAVVGLVSADSEKLPKTVKEAKEKTFLMSKNGKIVVDGVEKATVLPEFHRGSKVTFSCSSANDRNVRVSIDSEDKRVTYDWPVSPMAKMYFVSQFFSSKWKVMIE